MIDQKEVEKWKDLFDQINSEVDEEQKVPLSDEDYYADQIHNLTDEVDYDRAKQIAHQMAQMV